jgi:hypothetical protein
MSNNHGLRTKGVHTGNFGRPKVQGKPGSLDLSKGTLRRENLRVPNPAEAFTKLEQAYAVTDDPKLKAALWEMLRQRKAATVRPEVQPMKRPRSEYWERVKLVR